MVEAAQAIAAVGGRLRTVRQQRGLTLADVSGRTGVSASTLSRLESGQRRATLELLLPLAGLYGVALDDLIAPEPSTDRQIRTRPVERDGMVMVPLTRHPGDVQAFKIVFPRGRSTVPTLQTHDGYEWVYVLAGALQLRLGDEELRFVAGDAIEFDTRTPHWFGGEPDTGAEVLSLFGPQGERVHLREAASDSPEDPTDQP